MLMSDLARKIIEFSNKHNMADLSLMDKILSYCEENDLRYEDVGEELKNDKFFIELLKNDLIQNNYIRSEEVKVRNSLGDW
jgi:hypothetical protein